LLIKVSHLLYEELTGGPLKWQKQISFNRQQVKLLATLVANTHRASTIYTVRRFFYRSHIFSKAVRLLLILAYLLATLHISPARAANDLQFIDYEEEILISELTYWDLVSATLAGGEFSMQGSSGAAQALVDIGSLAPAVDLAGWKLILKPTP
jgi:hypothetical protein